MINIQKLAGILSAPKDHLAPDVFNSANKLLPNVKQEILSLLKLQKVENIKAIFILGSITGYKWAQDSDIDVMIAVDPYDPSKGKTKSLKDINGKNLYGTYHPINFFMTSFLSTTKSSLKNSDWGVYDVLEDTWLSHPGDPKNTRDPHIEFFNEIRYAEMQANKFKKLADRYKELKKEYEKTVEDADNGDFLAITRKPYAKVSKDLAYKDLEFFVNTLDKERKNDYSIGFGIPRNSVDNLVFKYIEHTPFYGDLFEEVKETISQKKLNN